MSYECRWPNCQDEWDNLLLKQEMEADKQGYPILVTVNRGTDECYCDKKNMFRDRGRK